MKPRKIENLISVIFLLSMIFSLSAPSAMAGERQEALTRGKGRFRKSWAAGSRMRWFSDMLRGRRRKGSEIASYRSQDRNRLKGEIPSLVDEWR